VRSPAVYVALRIHKSADAPAPPRAIRSCPSPTQPRSVRTETSCHPKPQRPTKTTPYDQKNESLAPLSLDTTQLRAGEERNDDDNDTRARDRDRNERHSIRARGTESAGTLSSSFLYCVNLTSSSLALLHSFIRSLGGYYVAAAWLLAMGQGQSSDFPYDIGEEVLGFRGRSVWSLFKGKSRTDGSSVSIFQFDKAQADSLAVRRGASTRLPTARW